MGVKETSKVMLHKFKRHFFGEPLNIYVQHVKQSFISHENSDAKYLFQKYSTPPPPGG